ncbi:MAG: transposase [Gammaproteobacteria bacterium]|nr:MAG: transposase [Gammaproteobacteria bacterium]
MTNYRRHFVPGGSYFFTVALADRSATLLTDHIDVLRKAFQRIRRELPFNIEAMVVLPDHLHCVWTLPPETADFSTRWKRIKAEFSHALPAGEQRSASRMKKGERGIWQRRFWEHALQDELDWQRYVDYVHYNPVKHGYMKRVAQWPYSTFRRYVKLGLYPLEWGGAGADDGDEFGE